MTNNFPRNWKICPLQDCMDAIIDYRGKTPQKTSFGIPLITAKIVKGGRIETVEEYISPDNYDDWMRRGLPQPKDVLITTEAPLGEIAQLDDRRVALAQRLITLRGKEGFLNNDFLKFLMQSDFTQRQLIARATGTTVLGIKQSELRKVSLVIPPLPEQKAIAHILGTLDDKIELNQQMNRTLEAMAKAIFKSWFVDFDPVRAKLDGRQPVGMDAETAALFPDGFEESALGQIPKGWGAVQFEELFLIPLKNGLNKPTKIRGLGTYMVNMGELFAHRRIGEIKMDRVPLTETEAQKNMLEPGDLLFARQSLTLEGAGQCSIIIEASEPRTYEGHLIRCRLNPEKADPWVFFYYFLSSQGQERIRSIVEQVAAAGIRGSDLAKLIVLAPPIEIQRCFSTFAGLLEQKIASNEMEARTLAALRDALLPKLLSGQLRIKAAERAIEEVVA